MDELAEQRKRNFLKRHPQLDKLVDRLLRDGGEDVQRFFANDVSQSDQVTEDKSY